MRGFKSIVTGLMVLGMVGVAFAADAPAEPKSQQAVAAIKKAEAAKVAWVKATDACVTTLAGLVDKIKLPEETAAINAEIDKLKGEIEWAKSSVAEPAKAVAANHEADFLSDIVKIKLGMKREDLIKLMRRDPDSTSTRKSSQSGRVQETLTWKYTPPSGMTPETSSFNNSISVTVVEGKLTSYSGQIADQERRGN